jgi:hypothetical protein
MLALTIRIGDLLASENEKGKFETRFDSDWDIPPEAAAGVPGHSVRPHEQEIFFTLAAN